MGARRFGPDTGRFLQQDQLEGALGDLGLAADPLTQNRYALAGGNPVSYVEWDGHIPTPDNPVSASGSTQEDWVRLARAGTLDLVKEVDFELAMPPQAALTFSDRDEIPEGPLKRAEIRAQQTSLDLLDVGYEPDTQALEAVRRLSRLQAEELARVLPEFARRRGQQYEELERRRAARLAEIARRRDQKPP
jgi:RHS repeat-associated protein